MDSKDMVPIREQAITSTYVNYSKIYEDFLPHHITVSWSSMSEGCCENQYGAANHIASLASIGNWPWNGVVNSMEINYINIISW